MSMIHKKIYTLFVILLTLTANSYGNSDAIHKVADTFFNFTKDGKRKAVAETKPIEVKYVSINNNKSNVFVVQQDGEGFAIISQHGDASSVVAYIPNGDFEKAKLSPSFMSVLQIYENNNPETTPPLHTKWDVLGTTQPLLDQAGVSLNQFYHASLGNCPTGCVATALAQIMAYHKFPSTGKGSHCYTHPQYGQQCADFENTHYNWTNPTYDDYELLSYHIGVATEMNYCGSKEGSSPSRSNYSEVLELYYGYSMRKGTRDMKYLKTEIDEMRPVYLELGGNPGHAVVIDGYKDENYLHLNFGWGGQANGYYMMNTNSTFWVGYTFGTNLGSNIFYSPTPFITNESDSLALIAIHNALDGTTGWNTSLPVSKWHGVITHHSRVVELGLGGYDYGVKGNIAPEIALLNKLQHLTIIGSELNGNLTADIFQLPDLESLHISKNAGTLQGEFPSQIDGCQKLTHLSMPGILTGTIPESIGNLVQLQELSIYNGTLSGSIPLTISQLTKLKTINISKNQLSGPIPDAFYNLVDVETLDLSENNLSGNLPISLEKMTQLKELRLNKNNLSGILSDVFEHVKNISYLDVSENHLSGNVPESIGKLDKLQKLFLHNNQFVALPNDMSGLEALNELLVNNNLLTTLPLSINAISSLRTIDASNNQITTLHRDFGLLRNLQSLNISNNQLTEIPSSIFLNAKLGTILLSNNKIKAFPSSIDFLSSSIDFAKFDDNELEGQIPLNLLSAKATHVSLINNRFTYEDVPVSDKLRHAVGLQKNHRLKQNKFPVMMGDTIRIDIRKISKLSHPDNLYYWLEYPKYADKNGISFLEQLQPNPILTVVINEKTAAKKFYCKVFNNNVPTWTFFFNNYEYINPTMSVVNTDTIEFEILSEDEMMAYIHAESNFIQSKQILNKTISDHMVTLVPPLTTYRGSLVWQASTDGIAWHSITNTMANETIKGNIVSIKKDSLVISPLADAFYRTAIVESDCNPLYSDTVHIKAYGKLLYDKEINTSNDDVKIELDDIEVLVPKGIHNTDFRITIVEVANPPAKPDNALKMSPVYDINVSFANEFYLPISIKFKNIDKESFDHKNIDTYVAMYFDDIAQEWVPFDKANISLQDTTLHLATYHFTKLAWFEMAHGSYTHIFTSKYVNVIYKYGDGYPESNFYIRYNRQTDNQGRQYWHDTNNDPDADPYGTPYLIQDVAHYMDSIIHKFKNMGLETPSLRFNVYVGLIGNNGMIDAGGYLAGRGYFYIDPQYVSYFDNQEENRHEMMRTLAHEYMHYTQDYYMTVLLQNYYWMEATAPIAARIVWEENSLPDTEPELLIQDALYPERDNTNLIQRILMMGRNKTIFETLSESWLSNYNIPVATKLRSNSADANIASLFLHYMQNYREGKKLNATSLIKETSYLETWIEYLTSFVNKHLESTVGKEFDDYVRYVLSGQNTKFSVLNSEGGNPFKHLIKNSESENTKAFALRQVYKFADTDKTPQKDEMSFTVPYLAAKIVLLSNTSNKQLVVVNYKPSHEPNEHYKVYYGRYDSNLKKVEYTDISDSTSFNILLNTRTVNAIDDARNTSFLLFVNTLAPSKTDVFTDFDASFELTASPVIAFTDVDYISVGTDFIHTYSDDVLMPFYISGAKRSFNAIDGEQILDYFRVDYTNSQISIVNDSTYKVSVQYQHSLSISQNEPNLPASLQTKQLTQTIVYNFVLGKLTIEQHANITNKWGAYYDDFMDTHHPESLGSTRTEHTKISLIGVNTFGMVDSDRLFFGTENTADTRKAILSMSDTSNATYYYSNGEVSGTSSRSYVSTDFSSPSVKIYLWVHYDQ